MADSMSTVSLGNGMSHFDIVDDIWIPPFFSVECFKSALQYKAQSGDIFIVTYPKCGTTWMQNIVINILRKGQPLAKPRDFFLVSPFLDQLGAEDSEKMMIKPGALKTHLPFHKVPWCENAKYIYVARNPKDCALSYFHHMRQLPIYQCQNGDIDVFLKHFLNGELEYNDYFDHLLSWYNKRHRKNIFFTTFESIKTDLPSTILSVAEFLGKDHLQFLEANQHILHQIIQNCNISSMRKLINTAINEVYNLNPESITVDTIPAGRKHILKHTSSLPKPTQEIQFVRTGQVGNWKTEFTEEQNDKFNLRIKNKTEGTDVMKLWESLH